MYIILVAMFHERLLICKIIRTHQIQIHFFKFQIALINDFTTKIFNIV